MKMGEKVMGSITETAHMASFATPEVRALFDEWAKAVEEEVLVFVTEKRQTDPESIAKQLKVSLESALYFIHRLAREGKLKVGAILINPAA